MTVQDADDVTEDRDSNRQLSLCELMTTLQLRSVDAGDGWEPALTNERADHRRTCRTTRRGSIEKLPWRQ